MDKQVECFMELVQNTVTEYFANNYSNLTVPTLSMRQGRSYYKLILDGSVWGFIVKNDGKVKGVAVKQGDLMKPAGMNAPAKHSRGNIINGTAKFSSYGPTYLK